MNRELLQEINNIMLSISKDLENCNYLIAQQKLSLIDKMIDIYQSLLKGGEAT